MLEKLFERLSAALQEAEIPYMIIGGQAVLLYGEPRLTKDVDITVGIGLDRLSEILSAALAAGLKALVDPETFTKETLVLPCADSESGLRVDFILSFSPFEQLAISRARVVRVGNVDLRFASLEDLIIHKLFAGRARDMEDVKNMLLKNPAADMSYIRHWLGEFSAATGEAYMERLNHIINDMA